MVTTRETNGNRLPTPAQYLIASLPFLDHGKLLRKVFGMKRLRPGQADGISRVLEARPMPAVMRDRDEHRLERMVL